MLTDDDEYVIPETANPSHLPVFDEEGQTIGYVDVEPFLHQVIDHKAFEHLRTEMMSLKNSLIRMQTQMRQMEQQRWRH